MAAKKKSLTKNVPKKNRYEGGGWLYSAVDEDAKQRGDTSPPAVSNWGYSAQEADKARREAAPTASLVGMQQSRAPSTFSIPPAPAAAIEPPATGGTGRVANVVGSSGGAGTANNPLTYADQSKAPAWAQNRVIPSRGTVSGGEDDGSSGSPSGMALAEQAFQRNMKNLGSANRFSPNYQGNSGPTFSSMGRDADAPDPTRERWKQEAMMEKMLAMGPQGAMAAAAMFGHGKNSAASMYGADKKAGADMYGDDRRAGAAMYGDDRRAGAAMYGDDRRAEAAKYGADSTANTARAGQAITARGQDLTYQGNENTNNRYLQGIGLQTEAQQALQRERIGAEAPLRGAQTRNYNAEADTREYAMSPLGQLRAEFENAAKYRGGIPYKPEEQAAMQQRLQKAQEQQGAWEEIQRRKAAGFFMGGEVEGYAAGGGIPTQGFGAAPQMQSPIMAKYGQYLAAAKQFGLPPMDVNTFAANMQSAQAATRANQTAVAMMNSPEVQAGQLLANGGLVEQDYAFADGGAIGNMFKRMNPFRDAAPAPVAPIAALDRGAEESKARMQRMTQEYGAPSAPQAPQQPQAQPQQPAAPPVFQGKNLGDIVRERGGGYAAGGAIPVQGQELQGVGPAAGGPTADSIPAVIDGSQPAALSSGEFVYTSAATDAVGAPVLKAVMKGLESGNPAVIQAMMQAAIKATAPQKPQQAAG